MSRCQQCGSHAEPEDTIELSWRYCGDLYVNNNGASNQELWGVAVETPIQAVGVVVARITAMGIAL